MEPYRRDRQKQDKKSTITGVALTVGIHIVVFVTCAFTGYKYLYPPPQEQSFVVDFSQEEPEEVQQLQNGSQPQAEDVDLGKEIELVQRSESPYQNVTKKNTTPATKPDNFGDVDVPTPKQKETPKLDARASFPGMRSKDSSTTAPHSAEYPGSNFKAGQPNGNTSVGKTDGTPNAHLKGRSVNGILPKPSYSVQEDGIVVVSIWVDQYGKVQKALPGADGTTVTDKTLWAEARKAALGATFNQKADAPALQEGTITYIFKLK